MPDAYLAISQIANDEHMTERMNAAVAQQNQLGTIAIGSWGTSRYNITTWVHDNSYLWASSPGWGEKWDYALAAHDGQPGYAPGKDPAVITDADILTVVQTLAPAPEDPAVPADIFAPPTAPDSE